MSNPPPNPYLQTLDSNEAITFVASLQKVKHHLSQELDWLHQQVQQKQTQLQGIEAILLEVEPASVQPERAASAESIINPTLRVKDLPLAAVEQLISTEVEPANSSVLPVIEPTPEPVQQVSQAIKATPTAKPPIAKPPTTSKGAAKPSTSTKSVKPGKSVPEKAAPAKPGELGQFLQMEFRGQPIAYGVTQTLSNAKSPLTIDDIMAEIYQGLSTSDYKRARHSLSTVLSTGKKEGKWHTVERGMYLIGAE